MPPTSSGNAVPLCDIEKIPTKTFIIIDSEVKVLSVMEPKLIERKQLNCQEMIVADESGALRLSVWKNEVNSMKQGESYQPENVSVCEYVGKKFVSTSTKASIIKAIPDIGQVDEQTQPEMSALENISKVSKLSVFRSLTRMPSALNAIVKLQLMRTMRKWEIVSDGT